MQKAVSRKNFIWNSLGAGLNSFHSPLFLFAVTRLMGIREAGNFSLAFATGLLLSNIGLFGVRSYQITDIGGEHTDAVYLNARIFSTVLMFFFAAVYALTRLSNPTLFWLILLQALWRVPEALADVMHGTFQMQNRLDIAGKSLFMRGAVCIVFFVGSMYLTRNLLTAAAFLAAASILVFILFDVRIYVKRMPSCKLMFSREVMDLLKACFPLFLISLLYAYLLNAQRYAIDLFGTPEQQANFSIVVLPASLLWALFILFMTPALPRLAHLYFGSDRTRFLAAVLFLSGGGVILCVLLFLFLQVAGIDLLCRLFGVDASQNGTPFLLACAAGGFLCVATVFSNLLVLLREKRILLLVYAGTSLMTLILSGIFVQRNGALGASFAYLCAMVFLFLALMTGFIFADRRRRREIASYNGAFVA